MKRVKQLFFSPGFYLTNVGVRTYFIILRRMKAAAPKTISDGSLTVKSTSPPKLGWKLELKFMVEVPGDSGHWLEDRVSRYLTCK
jgi:hypothetical protein